MKKKKQKLKNLFSCSTQRHQSIRKKCMASENNKEHRPQQKNITQQVAVILFFVL